MAAKKMINKKKESIKKTRSTLNKSEKIVLKHNIEAILFAAGKSLELKFISDLCDVTEYQIKKQLEELEKEYKEHSVLMIVNQDTSWKMTVREQYLDVVRKIVADTELTKSTLETLSMIAYRSPALQSDIVKARGTVTYDHVADLVKLGFVIKERIGRSYILKLSEKFFEYFEIDGKKIKEVFQPVKDRIDEQMLLGDLKIVNSDVEVSTQNNIFKEKTQEERLGELEVFRLENEGNAKKINDLKNSHKDFLNSIESEIDTFAKQTDEESKVFDEIRNSDVQNRINDIKSDADVSKDSDTDFNEEFDDDNSVETEESNTNNSSEYVLSDDSEEDSENDSDREKESNKLSSEELLSQTDKAIEELNKVD